MSSHVSDSTFITIRALTRLLVLLTLYGLTLTTACGHLHSVGTPIYETSDTVVRLEPISKVTFSSGGTYSHPVLLTNEHINALLTSISARAKVGLLRSFIGEPGTPRLFDRTDIGLLASPIQEALAKAGPGQAVSFYRTKNTRGSHVRVTSGVLFVRDDVLMFYVANFWHPVVTTASEVGSKDRLEDVRETTAYVREHPWVSVGDQDFAIFFDDPRHQLGRRESSLWDHQERTVAIAYRPYLLANPDPVKRAKEAEEAVQQATMSKMESQVITDLKKRLLELERANAALTEKLQEMPLTAAPTDPHPTASPQLETEQASTEKLLEAIQRLENRLSEIEREMGNNKR